MYPSYIFNYKISTLILAGVLPADFKIVEGPGNDGTLIAYFIGADAIRISRSMDLADIWIVYAARVAIYLAEDRRLSLDYANCDEMISGCMVRDTSALTQHDVTVEAGVRPSSIRCMDEVILSTVKNLTSEIHYDQSCWSTTLAGADADVDGEADADATFAVDDIVEAATASASASAETAASTSVSEDEKDKKDKKDKEDQDEEELRIDFKFAVQEQRMNEAIAAIKAIKLKEILEMKEILETIGNNDKKMDVKKKEEMKEGKACPDLDLLSVVTVRTYITYTVRY